MRARIAAQRARRYFRLSRVVAPFGVSSSFSSQLLGAAARLADGVDLLQHLPRALVDPLVGDLLVVEDHQLADGALAGVQLIAQLDDRLGDQSACARST